MTEQALIPLESINAMEVFTGNGLDDLLAKIRADALSLVPDVSTASGRKEIASVAYKVARTKITIDDAGKELVSEWKKKSAEVDASRKKARDTLDALKDEVRAPLVAWEAEQERIASERREAEERAAAEAEIARQAEIARKEAELRAREEAIAKAEQEAAAKAAAEQAERDRVAREEQMRRDAEEKAKREASEAIAKAEREKAEAVARAEREAAAAAEAARLAAEKAERDRAEAVRQAELRAKAEADAKEAARLAEERRIKAEEDARAADREHRKSVNNKALKALVDEGIDAEAAKKVITLIASGVIPAVSIRY